MSETNNFKDSMDRRLQSVVLRPELKESILAQCRADAAPRPSRSIPWRVVRRTAAVAAAAAVIAVSGVVGVAANPPLRRSLDRLGDDLVSRLQPVNLSDQDGGIRMEVLAAMNDEDVAVIYLTMQDTEKKGRLDDTLQLQNLCVRADGMILQGEELFSQAKPLWYDEDTQTVTMQLTSQAVQKIAGKKLSLTVRSFLSGEERDDMVDTGYTLADVASANPNPALVYPGYIEQYSAWGARMDNLSEMIDTHTMPVLTSQSPGIQVMKQYPWLTLNNAAVVNNMLHVQLSYDEETGLYNNCSVVLADEKGHVFDVSGANIALDNVVHEGYSSYTTREEQIALAPGEELYQDVHIYADVVSYAHQQRGEWETVFRLQPAEDVLSAECDIDMNPWHIRRVTVSPIGVTAQGDGQMYAYSDGIEMEVVCKDGSVLEVDSATTSSDGVNIQCKSIFSSLASMDEIDHVKINDHIIRFDG